MENAFAKKNLSQKYFGIVPKPRTGMDIPSYTFQFQVCCSKEYRTRIRDRNIGIVFHPFPFQFLTCSSSFCHPSTYDIPPITLLLSAVALLLVLSASLQHTSDLWQEKPNEFPCWFWRLTLKERRSSFRARLHNL